MNGWESVDTVQGKRHCKGGISALSRTPTRHPHSSRSECRQVLKQLTNLDVLLSQLSTKPKEPTDRSAKLSITNLISLKLVPLRVLLPATHTHVSPMPTTMYPLATQPCSLSCNVASTFLHLHNSYAMPLLPPLPLAHCTAPRHL